MRRKPLGARRYFEIERHRHSSLTNVDETDERISLMKDTMLKTEDELFDFEVADEALEIAGGVANARANFTLGACTGLSECPG